MESENSSSSSSRSVPILREWFDRVDSQNEGNITAAQLKSAFAIGNLHFPLSVVQQMIRMYDFDRNGSMSFQEFVELNKFLLKVQQAFADLERGLGYLVADDVYKGLFKIGISLDSPAFYTVCESFDQKKSGRFRLDDFISLCIFVQSARNLFNSFDTSNHGRVTLDLNQFIYCIADAVFSHGDVEIEQSVPSLGVLFHRGIYILVPKSMLSLFQKAVFWSTQKISDQVTYYFLLDRQAQSEIFTRKALSVPALAFIAKGSCDVV